MTIMSSSIPPIDFFKDDTDRHHGNGACEQAFRHILVIIMPVIGPSVCGSEDKARYQRDRSKTTFHIQLSGHDRTPKSRYNVTLSLIESE